MATRSPGETVHASKHTVDGSKHMVDMVDIRHIAGDRQRLAAERADGEGGCSSSGSLRSSSTRSAPASASPIAIARPMPCALPVTTAVRPVRSNKSGIGRFLALGGT